VLKESGGWVWVSKADTERGRNELLGGWVRTHGSLSTQCTMSRHVKRHVLLIDAHGNMYGYTLNLSYIVNWRSYRLSKERKT
jgi:hypothetical protein